MYRKLSKFYKSNIPDTSGFNIEELEEMAEEIRFILVGHKGLPLPEYIKRALKIPLIKLGHRRIYSIKKETRMEIYFPSEVWAILKERCDKVRVSRFTEEDNRFFIDNRMKGYQWLSEKMYITKRDVYRKAKMLGISVFKKNFIYTSEILNFIRNNANKGAKWISEKLVVSADAVRIKCRRKNIPLLLKKIHHYTPEEDEFIKNNARRGSVWISEQLKVNRRSVNERAIKIGVKLSIVIKNKIVKYFTPEEDCFIRKNSHKGATWIAEKLKRKTKSVVSRAEYKGIKLAQVKHHFYTPENDLFIRTNAKMGCKYLAEKLHVTPNAIYQHSKKLGLKIK